MKLRKPCEHGLYDAHPFDVEVWLNPQLCSGGEFLADDSTGLTADMIEKALATPDRKWSRGTIMDAAAAYRSILILNAKETV
jgi:hypothetical protein